VDTVTTIALTNLTLPYIKTVADFGTSVFKKNKDILSGLKFKGNITNKQVAEDTDMGKFYLEYR